MWNSMLMGTAVGRVAGEVEVRQTSGGHSAYKFTIAVNNSERTNTGEYEETTTWIRCTAWGKQGESIAKFVEKGSLVAVSGKLVLNEWTNKDGQIKKDLEMSISEYTIISSNKKSETKEMAKSAVASTSSTKKNMIDDNDIPF